MSEKVFISYRREDTAAVAGRVYDRLSRLLSKRNVFFDVSTIGGGEDFLKRIASEISSSDVALVFIGVRWLEPVQATGKARIWEADDHVRAEVRAAMARSIRVLPVLVSGASMPKPEQLPEDIRAITTKNALPLRHESFDDDTERLVAAVLGVSAKEKSWEKEGTLWSKFAYAALGALAGSVFAVIGALFHYWVLARPLSSTIGGPVTVLLLIAIVMFGVWLGLRYEPQKRRLR